MNIRRRMRTSRTPVTPGTEQKRQVVTKGEQYLEMYILESSGGDIKDLLIELYKKEETFLLVVKIIHLGS